MRRQPRAAHFSGAPDARCVDVRHCSSVAEEREKGYTAAEPDSQSRSRAITRPQQRDSREEMKDDAEPEAEESALSASSANWRPNDVTRARARPVSFRGDKYNVSSPFLHRRARLPFVVWAHCGTPGASSRAEDDMLDTRRPWQASELLYTRLLVMMADIPFGRL